MTRALQTEGVAIRLAFFPCWAVSKYRNHNRMSFPSALLALLASLFIIGCVTKDDQITPAQSALEKKDQREWSSEEGRIR